MQLLGITLTPEPYPVGVLEQSVVPVHEGERSHSLRTGEDRAGLASEGGEELDLVRGQDDGRVYGQEQSEHGAGESPEYLVHLADWPTVPEYEYVTSEEAGDRTTASHSVLRRLDLC